MTGAADLVTLPRTRFLYLALALFAILLVAGIVVVGSAGYADASCLESMPVYERQFGFKFGTLGDRGAGGTPRLVRGVVWLDPDGAFGHAGIRVGDVPRTYHGLAEFCGDLAAIADGDTRELSVRNVNDVGGQPRKVDIRLR